MTTSEKLVRSMLGKNCEPISFQLAGRRQRGWRRVVRMTFTLLNDPGRRLVSKFWRELHEQNIRLFLNAPIDWKHPRKCGSMTQLMDQPWSPGEAWGYSQVLAIPRMETLDILQLCGVGSRRRSPEQIADMIEWYRKRRDEVWDIMTPEQRASSTAQLDDPGHRDALFGRPDPPVRSMVRNVSKIMKIAPFAIQRAAEGALDATFLGPMDASAAKKVASLVFDANRQSSVTAAEYIAKTNSYVPPVPGAGRIPDDRLAIVQFIMATGKLRMRWGY
jgi:hypothetical protein